MFHFPLINLIIAQRATMCCIKFMSTAFLEWKITTDDGTIVKSKSPVIRNFTLKILMC